MHPLQIVAMTPFGIRLRSLVYPFNHMGHGHLDLPAYQAYLAGTMTDHSYEEEEISRSVAAALERLPALPGPGRT